MMLAVSIVCVFTQGGKVCVRSLAELVQRTSLSMATAAVAATETAAVPAAEASHVPTTAEAMATTEIVMAVIKVMVPPASVAVIATAIDRESVGVWSVAIASSVTIVTIRASAQH
jgi:hypothetical protein